jgi:hypothetical protein
VRLFYLEKNFYKGKCPMVVNTLNISKCTLKNVVSYSLTNSVLEHPFLYAIMELEKLLLDAK